MRISALLLLALSATAFGNEATDIQPYIEQLKKKHDIEDRIPSPQEIQAEEDEPIQLPSQMAAPSDNPQEVQPYIESVRQKAGLGASDDNPANTSSEDMQPYIDELKAGRELKAKYKKTVDSAAGFAVVASNRFDIHSDKAQANAFESVYNPDNKYSPSLDLFYERQLYRSRYFGSIGPVFHATYIHTKGKGIFTNARMGSNDTIFTFHALALSAGASYRLSQLRIVQPFIQGGLTGIPFLERRNDGKPSKRGISRGVNGIAGVAFNLDWIGRKNSWDQYDAHGIIHTYLVAQVEYLRSVSSTIKFNYDGFYGGLMFEF